MADWADNEEIKIFQEYLRIPSVHPDIDYGEFLNTKAGFKCLINIKNKCNTYYYIFRKVYSFILCHNKKKVFVTHSS